MRAAFYYSSSLRPVWRTARRRHTRRIAPQSCSKAGRFRRPTSGATGKGTIQRWLDRFDYGNRDLGESTDGFWLRGPLTISPLEQVAFLDRFLKNKIGADERTTQIVREMLVLEKAAGYVLSGKTGTAELTATRELGWLVGYVEVDDGVYVYALNMEGERVWEDWPPHKRSELVKDLLRELQVIPAAAE